MFYPNSFSREAAQELGLADESGYYDSYFYTQDLYRYIAESLLFDKLNLAHYDSVIAETGLAPRDQEHRIYYQRMSTMPTEYIYLRNNIYIERLSKSEIQLFLDAIDGDKAVINDELIAIVEKTMSLVLKKSVDLENSHNVRYGPPVPGLEGKQVTNNTLLFELAYQIEYDESGKRVQESKTNSDEQLLNETIPTLQSELSVYEEMPVKFFLGNVVDPMS